MDSVQPWLDAAEVRRLARMLLAPGVPHAQLPGDTGFGEQFVGYVGGTQPYQPPREQAPVVPVAPRVVMQAPVQEAPPPPVYQPAAPPPAQPPAVMQPAAAQQAYQPARQEAPVVMQPAEARQAYQPPAPPPQAPPVVMRPALEQQAYQQAAPPPQPPPPVVPPGPPQQAYQQSAPPPAAVEREVSQPQPQAQIRPPEPVVMRPVEPVAMRQPEPVAAEVEVVAPQAESGARGPFLDRFGRFRDWVRKHFASSGVFLLDRDGSVISDDTGHARLHAVARGLAQAARQPGAATPNVHMKIGAALTLEVLPVDTPYGCLVLGLLIPHPLVPDAVSAVVAAMRIVAKAPGE